MTDPVQLLIDAGAIPTTPFGPNSRYANVAIARYEIPDGAGDSVAYVLRRFVPQARDIPIALRYQLQASDRIDLLAAHFLGDAELHWRIADANPATDMLELTTTSGVRISIPLPPGT
ncbi:MAG TPA: Base plate wedge protein 53 [Burkholderiales bacterium]|nr:Base plate wedge protein 53 [Burkholderiales bacterium]